MKRNTKYNASVVAVTEGTVFTDYIVGNLDYVVEEISSYERNSSEIISISLDVNTIDTTDDVLVEVPKKEIASEICKPIVVNTVDQFCEYVCTSSISMMPTELSDWINQRVRSGYQLLLGSVSIAGNDHWEEFESYSDLKRLIDDYGDDRFEALSA